MLENKNKTTILIFTTMKKVLLILLVIIFGASISAENKSKAEATATDPASTVTSKA